MYNLSDFQKFINKIPSSSIGLLIGNFDGVHIGHQKLISNFISYCKKNNCEPVLFTFTPHPKFFFNQNEVDFLITSEEDKINLLQQTGVKNIFECHFDEYVQKLEPLSFFNDFIMKSEKIKVMYLGHDFKLGKGKQDSTEIIKNIANSNQVLLKQEESIKCNEYIVSSTLIRKKLKVDLSLANNLLGRPFAYEGVVTYGKGLGRTELVPTANLVWDTKFVRPKLGVYIGIAYIGDKKIQSVFNLGINPTTDKNTEIKLEVNFLFEEIDAYNKKNESRVSLIFTR